MRAIEFILETLSHVARGDEGPPPGVPAHVGPDFERELTSLCEWYSLSPIVLASLERLALEPALSRITLERLRALARVSAAYSDELAKRTVGIVRALAARGVDALVANDVTLSIAEYPSGLRPIERIDLLVHEGDWPVIVETLVSEGLTRLPGDPALPTGEEALDYYQYFGPCVWRSRSGHILRLRFRWFDLGAPEREELAWLRPREITIGDAAIRCAAPEDELVRSCLAFNMSRYGDLVSALDAAVLIARHGRDLDQDYVERRLSARGLAPSFHLALARVTELFHMPRHQAWNGAVGRLRRRLHGFVWRAGRNDFAPGQTAPHRLWFYLIESGSWIEKIRLLNRIASPRPEWVAAFFGRPSQPYLKMKFVLLALRNRVGMRVT